MLFDIKDVLIADFYIPEMEILKKTYKENCKKFFKHIDKKIRKQMPYHNCWDLKYKDEDELKLQKISEYEDLKYHYLSTILIDIVSLWENQLKDFYLLENYKEFNQIKDKFKEDRYYDFDSDKNIIEIRTIYNFLKHGQNGRAEKDSKEMKSVYYIDEDLNGEIRGKYLRNKHLEINQSDIGKFF